MQEFEFQFHDQVFRGKRWGKEGGLPLIALHGWLDNCASFDVLAPQLKNIDMIALDLAGQGQSDHRDHGGAYNIWNDIVEVIAVANSLGWDNFALLGHSRGAMIATLIAGTFPQRVSHLALIEAFIPHIVKAEDAPGQMQAAVESLLGMSDKSGSRFPSFESAIQAREKGLVPLNHEDATILAQRGVIEKAGKFSWNYDIKLNAPSEVKFTREQVIAFVDRISSDIALILADDGLSKTFDGMEEIVDMFEKVKATRMPGYHHLHMSQASVEVAGILNDYFSN
ncbi:MAG: alpha/beta hydrolase [Agarilytica sp.]